MLQAAPLVKYSCFIKCLWGIFNFGGLLSASYTGKKLHTGFTITSLHISWSLPLAEMCPFLRRPRSCSQAGSQAARQGTHPQPPSALFSGASRKAFSSKLRDNRACQCSPALPCPVQLAKELGGGRKPGIWAKAAVSGAGRLQAWVWFWAAQQAWMGPVEELPVSGHDPGTLQLLFFLGLPMSAPIWASAGLSWQFFYVCSSLRLKTGSMWD